MADESSDKDAADRQLERLEGALEELSPALFTWIVLRLGQDLRSKFEPDDLFQEIWLRAYESASSLDPALPVRPWLFGIARNVLREALRTFGRDRAFRPPTVTGVPRGMDRFADSITSVTRRLVRVESFRNFVDHLGVLSDDERRLVLLHGLEGITLADAAEHLDIGAEAAKKKWQRLRSKLEEIGAPDHLLVD